MDKRAIAKVYRTLELFLVLEHPYELIQIRGIDTDKITGEIYEKNNRFTVVLEKQEKNKDFLKLLAGHWKCTKVKRLAELPEFITEPYYEYENLIISKNSIKRFLGSSKDTFQFNLLGKSILLDQNKKETPIQWVIKELSNDSLVLERPYMDNKFSSSIFLRK